MEVAEGGILLAIIEEEEGGEPVVCWRGGLFSAVVPMLCRWVREVWLVKALVGRDIMVKTLLSQI